jgi:hypothetical protein
VSFVISSGGVRNAMTRAAELCALIFSSRRVIIGSYALMVPGPRMSDHLPVHLREVIAQRIIEAGWPR